MRFPSDATAVAIATYPGAACTSTTRIRAEHRCRCRTGGNVHALRAVRVGDLGTAAGGAALHAALAADGMALLVPDGDGSTAAFKFRRCLEVMESFFLRSQAEKRRSAATDGPGCVVGYMHNDSGGAEMFEAKCIHDPRWPWPDEAMRRAVVDARALLHDLALACLRALAQPLGLERTALEGLLDQPQQPLATCSNTTMRVWRYLREGVGNEVHVDNSLLTVAPAGSAVGLWARRYRDGAQLQPERQMAPGTVLVFAGDALSFLCGGRVPALVHWVSRPVQDLARYSFPFFLRARQDAVLSCASPPSLQLCQRQLEASAGGGAGDRSLRTEWPWKRNDAYYVAPLGQPAGNGVREGSRE